MDKKYGINTLLAHYGEDRRDNHGAVVPPIYQNSLFTFKDFEGMDEAFRTPTESCIYTRGNNPTVQIAERKIAALTGGEKCKILSSGMGAISSAIMSCVKAGCHIVAVRNIYSPAFSFMEKHLAEKCGISITFVEGGNIQEFVDACKENTSMIYLESPATMVFTLQDIAAVTAFARSRSIKTIIDNTWATPLFQKPLQLGVDLEVHSCSKYLGGHSDIVLGAVIGSKNLIDGILMNEHAWYGAKTAPFEAWLLTRSLRTLALRMAQHQKSALAITEYLSKHSKVRVVRYPGLKDFHQYELGKKQMSGYTGLFSFMIDTEDVKFVKKFATSLNLFSIGVSWGGHESLIIAPSVPYARELSDEKIRQLGINIGDIRLSIGLEDTADLLEDISTALKEL